MEGSLQRLQFGRPPDHAGLHTLDAACGDAECTRPGAHHEVGPQRCVDALDRKRWLRLDVEDAADLRIGFVADAQAAGRSGLLHARGDIHGDSADRAVLVHAAAEKDAATMDADANVEAGVAVSCPHFRAQCFAEIQQREAAAHGALGIVLGRAVRAKGGQDAVAGVLQHLAAVGFHDGRATRQRTVHHRADFLGIEVLRQRGRSHHIHEEDADVLEDLGVMLHGGSGTQCREPTAQRPERRIGDGVAQEGSLRLQALDGEFQLLKLRGGHWREE